jgi:hypothetical protein
MTIFRSSWHAVAIAGALVAPALLSGQVQDTTRSRVHVVRAGETLWRIAQDELGDGRRWREILKLNAAHVPSANRLPSGMRLRLPFRDLPPSTRRAPITTGTPAKAGTAVKTGAPVKTATPPRQATVPAAPPPRRVTADTFTPPAEVPGARERSIFYASPPGIESLGRGRRAVEDSVRAPPAVRRWEYVTAPFVADQSMRRRGGECVAFQSGRDSLTVGSSIVRFGDRLTASLPPGALVDTGTRFIVARAGPKLDEIGTVLFPTGIVRVVRWSATRGTLEAEVVSQFDAMSCGDVLLPLELPRDTTSTRPTAVANGPVGRLLWVASTALLPSLQHHVIISLGSSSGLKPGDQVTLFATHADSAARGSSDVGVATVLRVSARAATAMIITQSRAAIEVGMPVRVSAKLP